MMIYVDIEKLKKIDKHSLKKTTQLESILNSKIIEKINEKLSENLRIEEPMILSVLITMLLQGGGSNKNAGNSVSAEFEGYRLTSKQLLEVIQQFKKNGTIRQYARGIANQVHEVADSLELEGDLAQQMRLDHPDLSLGDAIWCSNFQTRNPKCPKNVRSWLNENHKNRFKN